MKDKKELHFKITLHKIKHFTIKETEAVMSLPEPGDGIHAMKKEERDLKRKGHSSLYSGIKQKHKSSTGSNYILKKLNTSNST